MSIDPIDASPYASLAELFGLDAERHAWRAYALCKTRPDLDWFPGRGVSHDAQKTICSLCPVTDACLAAAFNNGEKDGIWGGTSERERRRIRRDRNPRPNHPARIVNFLAEEGGTFHGSAGDLCRAAGVDPNLSSVVGHLEEQGRITVDPPAPRLRGHTIRTITLNRSTT